MLEKSLKAIAVTAAFCVTAMLSCVTASADSEEIYKSLEQLEWGMTLEEVETIMGTPDEKEDEFVSGSGQVQTLLTYEGLNYMGHDSYIILCYTEENGFEAVNFHIPQDTTFGLAYASFFAQLKEECTEYEATDDILSLLHFDNDNYTIFLADFGSEVQVSYFPLFDEADRGTTEAGGASTAAVHEPSPETGNTSAAMLVCVMTVSGIAAAAARKKINKI